MVQGLKSEIQNGLALYLAARFHLGDLALHNVAVESLGTEYQSGDLVVLLTGLGTQRAKQLNPKIGFGNGLSRERQTRNNYPNSDATESHTESLHAGAPHFNMDH
jgi:hypothetical protein